MVDFRYHIVSIVAVFLALALGLVLGTTTINPVVVRDLNGRLTQVISDKRSLETNVQALRDQAADGDAFARAATTPLVTGQLAGERVAVISLPGAPAAIRDQLVGLVETAGGAVTARLTLTDRYADPAQVDGLGAVVDKARPATLVLDGTSASQRSAQLLATVLTGAAPQVPSTPVITPVAPTPLPPTPLTPTVGTTTGATVGATRSATARPGATRTTSPPSTVPTPTTIATPTTTPTASPTAVPVHVLDTVLQEYRAAGFLSIDGGTAAAADMVLVVTADAPSDATPSPAAIPDAYLDLVGALSTSTKGNVVVSGPTRAATGGVLAAVRASGASNVVSTIDGADTPYGLVATIRAMRAQHSGIVGRYGVAANDRALPETATAP